MIQKSIQTIAQYLEAEVVGCKDLYQKICGVTIDSRKVEKGNLFIPIIGARADGHRFIRDVQKKGAAASLWQKDHTPYPDGISLILVDDTQQALTRLAKAYMKTLSCKVIGITGSNGKTSCKDMFFSVFSQAYKTQCTQGNHNNEIGLPLTVLDFDEDIEVAILEMGMENWNDIHFLCSIAQPDISVITTIGSAHMENLGSKENIARAKMEILTDTKQNGLFLYNAGSPEIQTLIHDWTYDPSVEVVSFGKNGQVRLTSEITYGSDGIAFTCSLMEDVIHLNALGDFQAENALPVIYTAWRMGLKKEQILYGLSHILMTKMRTQRLQIGRAVIIDDSYKSNPESAEAAIDTLMKVPSPVHIAVLSDMLDLGEDEQTLHEQIGIYAHENKVDILLCTGPRSRYTAQAGQGKWFETKEEIEQVLKDYLDKDCVILVKGSRAMAMDTIVTALQEDSNE